MTVSLDKGRVDVARLLLMHGGCDADAGDKVCAVDHDHMINYFCVEEMSLSLTCVAFHVCVCVCVCVQDGNSVLMKAVEKGDVGVVQELVSLGCSVNVLNKVIHNESSACCTFHHKRLQSI